MCGILGVLSDRPYLARVAVAGLAALQHRGQESAGLAISDGRQIVTRRGMGLISEALPDEVVADLCGFAAVGHTRYSTSGASVRRDAHPIELVHPRLGPAALVHNGNLVNASAIRSQLVAQGIRFQGGSDTETLARLIEVAPGQDWPSALRRVLEAVVGAYSCVLLTVDEIIAFRDPQGFRPLCIGCSVAAESPIYVLSSETCALAAVGASLVGEVSPGEMVSVSGAGLRRFEPRARGKHSPCIFEHVYFARADSVMDGQELQQIRLRMGAQLAREHPVDADVVIAVPDSGIAAALGYGEELGIPYREGFLRTRYVGRTFIQPGQADRQHWAARKLVPFARSLRNQRVAVVDDSIVRGTTCRQVVRVLRDAQVSSVHLRIASPPVRFPCFMGLDTGTRQQLIAADRTTGEVREALGADSLAHLSIEGMVRAARGVAHGGFCLACFNGHYPVTVDVPSHQQATPLIGLDDLAVRAGSNGGPS